MIRTFRLDNGRLHQAGPLAPGEEGLVWVDLLSPTREEERQAEAWLGNEIPTREEMEEIEVSSRLYSEDGAHFLTAIVPSLTDNDRPVMAPVTFVLSNARLVTIRYSEPKAFTAFPERAARADVGCVSAETVMLGILEAIIDRLADILEKVGREIIGISHGIFHPDGKTVSKRDLGFQLTLRAIGRKEEVISNIQESLLSLERMMGFLAAITARQKGAPLTKARVKTMARDVQSLTDHAGFLAAKITFLLDATLGMINIEQNAIIKIFSIAAVVFLPPTLIGTIYGMNFEHMPELGWRWAYPAAVIAMVVSAIAPYLYFKRKGWM